MSRRPLTLALVTALAGCSGGGGGASAPIPTAAPQQAYANAAIAIVVPPASAPPAGFGRPASHARAPRYVSPGTTTVLVYINTNTTPTIIALPTGTPGTGGTTYSVNVPAPVGNDTFTVNLVGAKGTTLATGTGSATISTTITNVVPITVNGLPATSPLTLATLTPPIGNPLTIALGATAYDVQGYPISGTFAKPVTLKSLQLAGIPQFATTGTGTTPPSQSNSVLVLNGSADAAAAAIVYDGFSIAPIRPYAVGPDARIVGAATIRPGATQLGRSLYVVTGAPDNGLYKVDTGTYAVTRTTIAPLPATPTSLLTSPDGAYLLIGMTNGAVAVYNAATLAPQVTLPARGTPPAPSVIDMVVDDRVQTLYILLSQGDGTFAVDSTVLVSGGAQGTHNVLPSTAKNCGGVAVDFTNSGVAVSCGDAMYGLGLTTAGNTFASFSVGAGGRTVVQQLPPFQVIAANRTSGASVFTGVATSTSFTGTLTRTIANPAGSTAIALDSTYQTLYAGTASTVEIYDVTSIPPTSASLGSIPIGSAPLQIASIPGGAVRPDAKLFVVTAAGKVVAVDPVALTVLGTAQFGTVSAVAEAFGP